MSNEINNNEINKVTELSEQELDTVAGGASLEEFAALEVERNSFGSTLIVGPQGVISITSASEFQQDVDANKIFKNDK